MPTGNFGAISRQPGIPVVCYWTGSEIGPELTPLRLAQLTVQAAIVFCEAG